MTQSSGHKYSKKSENLPLLNDSKRHRGFDPGGIQMTLLVCKFSCQGEIQKKKKIKEMKK